MFTWEWNPSFGGEAKPQRFEHAGENWTYVRGGQTSNWWLPAFVSVWGTVVALTSESIQDKAMAGLACAIIALGWFLSRRFLEKGWRVTAENHLLVLTHSNREFDLGVIDEIRAIEASDFEQLKCKSFNSLRFPMVQFKSEQSIISIIGSIPKMFSSGFHIPFTLGFFYSSITWGSFELQAGQDRSALVVTNQGKSYLVIAYTPEALREGFPSVLQ